MWSVLGRLQRRSDNPQELQQNHRNILYLQNITQDFQNTWHCRIFLQSGTRETFHEQEYVYFPVQRRNVGMRQEELSFLSHAPIGSLCSLSSFSHNGGFNTKRSLIKRREAALQASTEPSVPFLHTSAIQQYTNTSSACVSCEFFTKNASQV